MSISLQDLAETNHHETADGDDVYKAQDFLP